MKEGSGSRPAPLIYGSGPDPGGPKTYGFRIRNTGWRLGRICTSSFLKIHFIPQVTLEPHTQLHSQPDIIVSISWPTLKAMYRYLWALLGRQSFAWSSSSRRHPLWVTTRGLRVHVKKGRRWPLSRVHSVMMVLPLSSLPFSLVTTNGKNTVERETEWSQPRVERQWRILMGTIGRKDVYCLVTVARCVCLFLWLLTLLLAGCLDSLGEPVPFIGL